MNNNTMELTLEGIAFNGLKSDFNTMLRKTLNKMCQKESEQAEISVKVKISFEKIEDMGIIKPKFDHKVSSAIQIKDEVSGCLKGDYMLAWDSSKNEYVMKPIKDKQVSIFDEYNCDEGPDKLMIEDTFQNFVDGECKEI